MYLRFESPIAGHTYSYSPGDVVEYPKEFDREAIRLVERGIAEEITKEAAEKAAVMAGRPAPKRHKVPRPEAAITAPPENAMRPHVMAGRE